ncbi:hypothetical protein [Salinispira pacifica]
MRVRCPAALFLLLLLSSPLFALGDLQLGAVVDSDLPAWTTTASAVASASYEGDIYRDQVNSLRLSADSTLAYDPWNARTGGQLSLGLTASVIQGLTTYDAGFFGNFSGDTTDGVDRLEGGARGGIVTGDLDWSVSVAPSITRMFLPDPGWAPGLTSRVDLRLSPSLNGSLRATLGAVGYDSGDASWTLSGGPAVTWYMGSAAVLDVGVAAAVSRSTLTSTLSDLGASGSGAAALVRYGDYRGLEWSAEWALSVTRGFRAVVSAPGYFRVMGYDHYEGGVQSAPEEWIVAFDPGLAAAFDLTESLSLHFEPRLSVTYSNSDYRRGTQLQASVYVQLQF